MSTINKHWLLLYVFLHTLFLSAQEINQIDESGKKQGVWKEITPENPEIDYILVPYKDGLEEGIVKAFYLNGKIAAEVYYEKGELHGIFKNYYENGNIRIIANYENGKLEGKFAEYRQNGKLKTEKKYCKNLACDYYKEYYENGNIHIDVNILSYGESEKIEDWKIYFDTGELKLVGRKRNNENIGVWKEYNIDGELTRTIEY